jgi:transposase
METCATAHHRGRVFAAVACAVRLNNARLVTPFMRGAKNDAPDADAIHDPASRPTMRFVPVKTVIPPDVQSVHRVRDRLAARRTAPIDPARGLMAGCGIVHPAGAVLFVRRELAEAEGLSPMARETFAAPLDEPDALKDRVGALDERLVATCREDEACRRMAQLPGVGPVVATAPVASVGDAGPFRSGRERTAGVGLVPRQPTSWHRGRPPAPGAGESTAPVQA